MYVLGGEQKSSTQSVFQFSEGHKMWCQAIAEHHSVIVPVCPHQVEENATPAEQYEILIGRGSRKRGWCERGD